jgi:hypothetical protein
MESGRSCDQPKWGGSGSSVHPFRANFVDATDRMLGYLVSIKFGSFDQLASATDRRDDFARAVAIEALSAFVTAPANILA